MTFVLTLASIRGAGELAVVDANNWEANNGFGAPIYYLNQGTLAPVGQNIFVQILAGPLGGALQPTTDRSGNALTISLGTGGSGPGFFDGGDEGFAIVPGVAPGAQAQFEVRAWQGTAGFQAAKYAVTGPIWTQATIGWSPGGPAPLFDTLAPPWASLTIVPVPEPSTLALALLGGMPLVLRRLSRRVPNRLHSL